MRQRRLYSVTAQVRACELIYDIVKSDDGTVSKSTFCDELAIRGILPNDPRLAGLMTRFGNHADSNIHKELFLQLVSQDVGVIERAFSNSNVIPYFEKFSEQIRELYYDCVSNTEGKLSGETPQLAKQNPKHFGVSVCTVDGQRMNIGHTNFDFSIQSCTKPISYCMALEENGITDVHNHIGREPSGIRFNALKLMSSGLPHNPLINSGAIMTCALIQKHMEPADKFDYVTKTWADLTGGFPLAFSNSAYLSLKGTSDREYALAHFLRENDAFPSNIDIDQVLEFYFQCFALSSNSDHLSIVAGSLANGGVCPLTGKQVFSPETVKNCLSMMYTCGMYDYSGEFAFTIGLPASSGDAGAIMVVIPNVMGICTFSPLLDKYGNSARGVEFFLKLTKKFNFHLFDNIENTGDKEDPRSSVAREEVTVEKVIRYSSLGDLGALKRLNVDLETFINADCDLRTPLHLAASNGHLSVVKYILEEIGKEHVNPIDRWSGTPYDDAMREMHYDVAEYMKSIGGRRGIDLPQVRRKSDETSNGHQQNGNGTTYSYHDGY